MNPAEYARRGGTQCCCHFVVTSIHLDEIARTLLNATVRNRATYTKTSPPSDPVISKPILVSNDSKINVARLRSNVAKG